MSLPVCPAHELAEQPEERRWLIEGLWSDQAVGLVGGEPKLGKSFLALDMAVSVASGAPCLRHYPVRQTGRVLVYPAEDALHVVRERLDGICEAAGVSLPLLDVLVITRPGLRLDIKADREALRQTVDELRPRLLILDPLTRLHAVDENVSAEVSPILGYLRILQRTYETAVLVVHHARKGAGKLRQGQALRGSSELHGFGDSNLYLHRVREQLTLSIEHRAAPSQDGVAIRLNSETSAIALEIVEVPIQVAEAPPSVSPVARIEEILLDVGEVMSGAELRRRCGMRHQHFWEALKELMAGDRVVKSDAGYRIPDVVQPRGSQFPVPDRFGDPREPVPGTNLIPSSQAGRE